MAWLGILFGAFGGAVAGAAIAFGVNRLVPRLWKSVTITGAACMTGYAALWLAIDFAERRIAADPTSVNVDGPSVFLAVMNFGMSTAIWAFAFGGLGAYLVLMRQGKK